MAYAEFCTTDEEGPRLVLSDAHAQQLLLWLGITDADIPLGFNPKDLYESVQRLKGKLKMATSVRRTAEFRAEAKVREDEERGKVIDMATDEFWLLERCHDLEDLCLHAADKDGKVAYAKL